MSSFLQKYWLIIAAILLISLIAGIVALSVRMSGLQPVEITLRDSVTYPATGDIYISGAVIRPGIYQVRGDDTLTTIISSAGILDKADLSKLRIYVPEKGEFSPPQKVNLNTAEAWLLQALPGIGEGKASAIIDYRVENGHFCSVDDLLKIDGFGKSIVDKIRDFVTVGD